VNTPGAKHWTVWSVRHYFSLLQLLWLTITFNLLVIRQSGLDYRRSYQSERSSQSVTVFWPAMTGRQSKCGWQTNEPMDRVVRRSIGVTENARDLENAGPYNFTSCWVWINSLNNKLITKCVCVLDEQHINERGTKERNLSPQRAQAREMNSEFNAVSVTWPILLLIILKKWNFYMRTVTSCSFVFLCKHAQNLVVRGDAWSILTKAPCTFFSRRFLAFDVDN